MNEITVIKRDASGKEVWHYSGQVLERSDGYIRIQARFNRKDTPFHGIILREGDQFIESYFADRWYNYDEVHDKDSQDLKCYYANVTRPAEIGDTEIAYDDLALDLLVYPDGRQLVLDEDEFQALQLPEAEQKKALQALAELKEEPWTQKR
jgi:predicted RNA-binding protein associated with RNAse of E/G family